MSTQPTIPSTTEDLAVRFGAPHELAVEHKLQYIDEAAERFLAQCPFVIVSTADAEGRCDASPKGDPPGFIHVGDKHTLYLPDRAGNRMFQSIGNILANPHVGLLFLIPGEEWTMRRQRPGQHCGRSAAAGKAQRARPSSPDGDQGRD